MLRSLSLGLFCLMLAGLTAAAQESADEFEPPVRPRRNQPDEDRQPISLDGGASINPFLLSKIEDETLGLTIDDREAYFRILKLTRKLPPEDLQLFAREFREIRHAASTKYSRRPIAKFPVFVDLFQHPAEYRGRPVSLHGYFRRLVSYDAGENEQGISTLYEGWLYPDDGQGNPAVVIFTELPDGLKIGDDITEEVSVTGYFLKMYGYRAQDAPRKAPLILADTVRWHPQHRPARWTPSPGLYAAITGGIILIGLMIFFGVREAQLRRREEWRSRHPDIDTFALPESVAETLPPSPSSNGVPLEPHH